MTRENFKKLLPLMQKWADGSTAQLHNGGGIWHDIDTPGWTDDPENYRIKPNRVPLGPEDVPPGSAFRSHTWTSGAHWMPTAVTEVGSVFQVSKEHYKTWNELLESWEIKRPGEDWKPCYRETED